MRTIMFCLPESGKFGQDSFKSLVVRRMIRKQADTLGRFERLGYLLHNKCSTVADGYNGD